MNHKLDTDTQVFFYEQDFYVLSNFSSFNVEYNGIRYPTSEHAYHAQKFIHRKDAGFSKFITDASSAHQAFKYAQEWKSSQREDWDNVKVEIMKDILWHKIHQHEYVKRKLLATGNRELIEDSWRDDYWGWGENKDGKNILGKLWMEIRTQLQKENQW